MQFNSNRTSLRTFIFPTRQGFLPSGVTKIHSLVQTGLTARSWQSELALRGLSSFTPSGFMLAHVFFVPLLSSFVLVSHETSSPSGLFTFVFEFAHMALNSFASRQRHYHCVHFLLLYWLLVRVWKNFAMYFCSYPRRSSSKMPCSLIFNRLKTGDSRHWFKISPQFFLNPKPTVPRGSTKRACIRGENGLLSFKKL